MSRMRQIFSAAGDGSGDSALNIDGTTPTHFFVRPETGDKMKVDAIVLTIEDGATWTSATLGGMTAPSNGVALVHRNELTPFAVHETIFTGLVDNNQFLLSDWEVQTFLLDSGERMGRITIRFEKGMEIYLDGLTELRISIADDLQALTSFQAVACGEII